MPVTTLNDLKKSTGLAGTAPKIVCLNIMVHLFMY